MSRLQSVHDEQLAILRADGYGLEDYTGGKGFVYDQVDGPLTEFSVDEHKGRFPTPSDPNRLYIAMGARAVTLTAGIQENHVPYVVPKASTKSIQTIIDARRIVTAAILSHPEREVRVLDLLRSELFERDSAYKEGEYAAFLRTWWQRKLVVSNKQIIIRAPERGHVRVNPRFVIAKLSNYESESAL